ncbi:hypothetical protein LXM25_09365 [Dyadobacter sp. LJ53]|uniref:hypothetical protein n=1 Tax=Dyadobacter chenwenxiniae TaxID=2906456 RepID=UPI001F32EB8C|nr:hypothetical protein [Dyadobacter chenwenxiniae]MCF0050264.1 hypothetical protein [Dyadobacter chenwenxiniae]
MKKLLLLVALIACNQPTPKWPDPKPIEPVYIPTAEDSARTRGPFMRIHPMGQYPEMIHDNLERQPALKIEEWLSTTVPLADFGRILKPGQEMEMVAFGGGLTAGVMNGGITRESQQSNYTNLLAHQMGIKNFAMPLFEKEHYNGTGYYVYRHTDNGYPQWDRVVNNTVSVLLGTPTMPEYQGKISNFALPDGSAERFMMGNDCVNCDLNKLFLSRFKHYLRPYLSEAFDEIKSEIPYNFVVIEEFFDRWMYGIQAVGRVGLWDYCFNGSIMNTGKITDSAINNILNKGQKGVIFTIPRFQDLAYMNWYSTEELKKRASEVHITFNKNNMGDGLVNSAKPFSLIPTAKLHSLFERFKDGDAFMANLEDKEVLDSGECYMSDPALYYNHKIREYAVKKDLAVVDLFDLYQRIHKGGYVTDDGVLVDGTLYGNFFSSDGTYPSPLGQAIITNEVIKAVNQHYGAKIPLVDIVGFAKSVEVKK